VTSIFDVLAGGVKNQDYLGSNPYYSAGANILQSAMPRAETNAQALAFPLLQGLIGGGLVGYGKNQATEAAYQDASNSPLLSALTTERPANAAFGPLTQEAQQQGSLQKALLENSGVSNIYGQAKAPEGFTPETGRQDLLMALVAKQTLAESEAKKQAIKDEIASKYGPDVLKYNKDLEAAKADEQIRVETAKAIAQREAEGDGGNDLIPSTVPKSLRKSAIEELPLQASKKQAFDAVDKMYGQAKDIKRIKGAIPATSESNELGGQMANMKFIAQRMIGTEPGPKVLADLEKVVVDWNDTDSQVEEKKAAAKRIFESINKPTPILDKFAPKPSPGAAPAPTPTPPTYTDKDLIAQGYKKVAGGWSR